MSRIPPASRPRPRVTLVLAGTAHGLPSVNVNALRAMSQELLSLQAGGSRVLRTAASGIRFW
jgi:hypothetical protein